MSRYPYTQYVTVLLKNIIQVPYPLKSISQSDAILELNSEQTTPKSKAGTFLPTLCGLQVVLFILEGSIMSGLVLAEVFYTL